MVEELIKTFEELKKYVFLINRGQQGFLSIRFHNNNFYHLVGFHKLDFDKFFPTHIKSKDKRYKYIKKNVQKFNNILDNQLKEKDRVKLRIYTFHNVLDLLKGYNTSLYNLKPQIRGSMYDGDYGLMKTYQFDICCLLGLKIEEIEAKICKCVPQSWMASTRINRLVEFKKPIFMEAIYMIPIENYTKETDGMFVH